MTPRGSFIAWVTLIGVGGLAMGCATRAPGPSAPADDPTWMAMYADPPTWTATVRTVGAPGLSPAPPVIRIDRFTCGELLALPGESNDRMLIFFNGFMAGLRQRTTWDVRVEGEMVERAVGYCRADPTVTVLSAFLRAEPRWKESRWKESR